MHGLNLEELLAKKRIIVCCGSGGIGKTTISAVLGVHGALLGKKVLTLTIDPAKRLANSLGLSEIGNTETLVPKEKFLQCGRHPTGSLYALMLDTKHTFDELIKRYAPNEDISQNILNNQFYKNLSSAIAGSHEYLAMEKPILCVRSDEDLLETSINQAKAGVAARNVQESYDFILEKWNEWKKNGNTKININRDYTTKFSRKLQAKEFVDLFEKSIAK